MGMKSVPVILLITATVIVGYSDDCPSHLSRSHLFSHGNHCIQLVTNQHHSWTLARQDCQSQGGDLVEIRDAETQSFITSIIRQTGYENNGYWIGATDSDQEGTWKWISGDLVSAYSHWESGEGPSHHGGGFLFSHSNTGEDCAVIKPGSGYRWHDYSCTSIRLYICQYTKFVPLQPQTTDTSEQTISSEATTHLVDNKTEEEMTTSLAGIQSTMDTTSVETTEQVSTKLNTEITSSILTTSFVGDRKTHGPTTVTTPQEACVDMFSKETCQTITQNCTNAGEIQYCRRQCKHCCSDNPKFDCSVPSICSSLSSVHQCPLTCGYCPCKDHTDCLPLRQFCSINEIALKCAKTCNLCN